MTLSPLAVAVQGISITPLHVAVQGFVIETSTPVVGDLPKQVCMIVNMGSLMLRR